MKFLVLFFLIAGNSYAIIGFERCLTKSSHVGCHETPIGWYPKDSTIIYKILRQDEFRNFYLDGYFTGSRHDQRDGFIHLSNGQQLGQVLDKYFKGESVYIVALYPETLGDDLIWENNYPHLYHSPLRYSDSIGVYFLDLI